MKVAYEKCHICGETTNFIINDKAVLLREAKCDCCGASIRNSDVAGELLRYIHAPDEALESAADQFAGVRILNACSSGYIHDALKDLDEYTCCEYFDEVPSGEYADGVLCVDLCDIPFPANTFDLVITEDVFEHIAGYEKAMEEILRVLKVGGSHIFTVPIHENKKTESRESKRPVYHGDPVRPEDGTLVITDWGKDIKEIVEAYGYSVEVKKTHSFYTADEITDVDLSYEEYSQNIKQLDQYLKYNSIVIVATKKEEGGNYKETYIHPKSAEIVSLNKTIRNKNDIIRALNDDNEARGKHIVKLDTELEAAGKRIVELQEDDKKKNRHIEGLIQQNNELKQTVLNKEGHIELLLEVEREYEREKNTHAYKFAKKLQRAGDWLLPVNSRRRFFARIIYNIFRHPRLMLHVVNPKRIKNYLKYMRLEGMEGVKRRYEEAVDIERMQMDPSSRLDLKLEQVGGSLSSVGMTAADYDTITFPVFTQPTVSIIIPTYNEFNYTYSCLKSILKNSGDIAYEIVVADDCSIDVTKEIEKIAENVRLITTEKNVGFLLNCNNAAQHVKGKYILFLNNDTQVQENWLEPLVNLIEQDEKIGMVGSKLVYPDGYLQEAGGIVWQDASAWNYGNRKSPEDPEYNYVKEVDYISGAAIMIRRNLWEEIGGFDERYVPAYYEDTDLAFEVRRRNYKVLYQPLSVVVHFEGISNGTDTESGLKQYQQINYQKFYDKWQDILQSEHEPNGVNVFTAKDRSNHKKHILVVDHYVPHHDQDAGGKCTYMYLKLFLQMGFQVTFIGDNYYKHEPYTTELNQMGIEVLYGNFYYHNWQQWLKENSNYFDYIYLQRPHIAEKYIDLVRQYSGAKILYFAHDLHYIREYREYEMTKDSEMLASSEMWKEMEYDLFSKADVGHVVGSYEQKIIQEAFPDKPIRNIPLYIYDSILTDIVKDFSGRHDLLYVGGFGHPPNVDAVLWFAKEVFPIVLEKYPNIKWHVVGGKVPKEIKELESENIIIEGFVPDEVLEKLYRACRMAVVPLRFGAGVKGKVVEAAYFQIPLVTTTIGAEGLNLEDQSMLVEDDSAKMAELICSLYQDYDRLRTMSDAGIKFIEKYFMWSEAERVIRLDILI